MNKMYVFTAEKDARNAILLIFALTVRKNTIKMHKICVKNA
jgi:hypothetical protein